MKDLLFDTPWWLLAALFAGGIAIWWSGNNRQDKTLKRMGLVGILLGVTLAMLSYFVDTDKEYVLGRTQLLVTSVNKRDWPTFESVLDPKTTFAFLHNRDEIVDGAKKTSDAIGLKGVHMLRSTVEQRDTAISVEFSAYSEQDRTMGRPIITNWRFDWQNFGTGWRLQSITPLPSEQVKAEDITRSISR